jgi:hypothetical protein
MIEDDTVFSLLKIGRPASGDRDFLPEPPIRARPSI